MSAALTPADVDAVERQREQHPPVTDKELFWLSQQLEPCPHCGGNGARITRIPPFGFKVACPCMAAFSEPQDALAQWNRRAAI
jgi:hypothetical protein